MMLADDVDKTLRKAVFPCQSFPFSNVSNNDLSRFLRGQELVHIESAQLIFSEVMGVKKFSNIMIERRDTAKKTVCIDGKSSSFRKISYDKRMLVATRRFQTQPAQ